MRISDIMLEMLMYKTLRNSSNAVSNDGHFGFCFIALLYN